MTIEARRTGRHGGEAAGALVLFALLLAVASPVHALHPAVVLHTVRTGLPQSQVTAVVQDRVGYLWVGTESGGVARWNGHRWDSFGSSDGLPSDEVRALALANDGSLLVGTATGAVRRSGDSWAPLLSPTGDPSMETGAILASPDGTTWIGMAGGLVALPPAGAPKRWEIPHVSALARDAGGTLWIGTRDGLFELRPGSERPAPVSGLPAGGVAVILVRPEAPLLAVVTHVGLFRRGEAGWTPEPLPETVGRRITALRAPVSYRARRGLWIGTEDRGAFFWDGAALQPFGPAEGLAAGRISAIFEDREGIIWIGFDAGLAKRAPSPFLAYDSNDGLPRDTVVFGMAEARDGSIWAATSSGPARLGRDDRWTVVPLLEQGEPVPVNDVTEDEEGRIWIASARGIARDDHGRFAWVGFPGHPNLASSNIVPLPGGGVAIGTMREGLFFERGGQLRSVGAPVGSRVSGLSVTPRRTVLACGFGWGVAEVSVDGEARLRVSPSDLPSPNANLAVEDSQGRLWVATERGVLEVDPNGRTRTWNGSTGLPTDFVYWAGEDAGRGIWFGTNRGVARLAPDGRLEVFREHDGLPEEECNDDAFLSTRDGRIFVGSVGVARFEGRAPTTTTKLIPLRIEAMHAAGRSWPIGGKIELPPRPGLVRIDWAALSFEDEVGIRFHYRLLGLSDDWTAADAAQRDVLLGPLPAGRYVFEVRAGSEDGRRSNVASQLLVVAPTFVESPWTRLAAALLLLAAVFAVYRLRISRMRREKQHLEEVVHQRTRSLEEEKERTELALAETERQRQLAEGARLRLEEQERRLVELDQLKTRFFSNISHEFRTPLTLVIGPLERALGGSYGEISVDLRKSLDVTLRNSRRVLRLLNQLLDVSRFEAEAARLEAEPLDIVPFVRSLTEAFGPYAEKKSIHLTMKSNAESLEVWFDREKLDNVLFNLLSNAFKFTEPGGKIWIGVDPEPPADGFDAGAVRIAVRDTGHGIPADELPKIFDRFHQVAGSTSSDQAGSGIGLSLVHDIVLLHHGRIEVKSELGFGSEFVVRLPLGRAHLAASEIRSSGAPARITESLQLSELRAAATDGEETQVDPSSRAPESADLVLVAEDNADMRSWIRQTLRSEFRVATAADGEEALARVRELRPALVVSDVMMPRKDGYDLCRAIRADPELEQTPVLLLTAKASEEMRVEGLEVGADDYLTKPFNPRELAARARNLVRIRRQERELRDLNERLEVRAREQVEQLLRSRRLTKYLPSTLVKSVLSSGEEVRLASRRMNVTAFFSDLSGFTDLTDRIEPERITRVLNEYLTEMVGLVDRHGATLDKFMGDGVMALFGAPEPMDPREQALKAVGMAVVMQHCMARLGRKWLDSGLDHDVRLRIGLHQGYATVGNFGSESLMEYTAIGGVVNLSSRLENFCTPGRILASFEICSLTKDDFPWAPLEERTFKGFARQVRVAELDPSLVPER